MIGELPTSLEVNGVDYPIDADYRNILTIFEAYEDDSLTPSEKAYVCLRRLYKTFDDMSQASYREALEKALAFLSMGSESKKTRAKLMDWKKDEQLIFPAVNKAAGQEVRALPYMHWWTFMGFFESIDHESLFGTILGIRQKRSKGKKLEKWEAEFEKNNRDICSLTTAYKDNPEDALHALFNSLSEGGGE